MTSTSQSAVSSLKSSILVPAFALGAVAVLSGCSSTSGSTTTAAYAPLPISLPTRTMNPERDSGSRRRDQIVSRLPSASTFNYPEIYAARVDEGVSVPAFDYTKMNSRFLRKEVRYFGPEPRGTIVIDARRRHLYLVLGNRRAIRYGIAVGKEGFGWTGNARLQWKQKWPTWTPPAEMIARRPELKKYAKGLEGSVRNPLGARAMYLFQNGRDTMYRIHGTDKPFSIGKAASSGCFRMINQDVIDLYKRVGVKGAVMVRPQIDLALVQEGGR